MKTLTALYSLLILLPFNLSYAQDADVNLIQFFKGDICDIKIGSLIGDILHDGEILEVEKYSGEGNAYFIFNIKVLDCGVVRAHAIDEGLEVVGLETNFQKYSTKQGAKVGMTLSEITELYPQGTMSLPTKKSIEFSVSYYLPNQEGYFEFNADHLKDKCINNMDKCKNEIDALKADVFGTY